MPDGNPPDDARQPVDQVDDDTVLGEHDPLRIDARCLGERRIRAQVPPLAVDGHRVGRAHRVVEEQLAGRGMAGDVHLRTLLRDDLRPRRTRPLTTANTEFSLPGISDDARTTRSLARMLICRCSPRAIRDSAESGSPLRPGGDEHQPVVGQRSRSVDVDDHAVGTDR